MIQIDNCGLSWIGRFAVLTLVKFKTWGLRFCLALVGDLARL